MISKSIGIIRDNWLFYVIFVVTETLTTGLAYTHPTNLYEINLVMTPAVLLGIFLQALLALYVFRSALYGLSFGRRLPNTPWAQGLIKLTLKAAVLLMISAAPHTALLWWAWHSGFTVSPQVQDLRLIVPTVAIYSVCTSVVLSYAGTWLPASVYRGDPGLHSALRRGNRAFRAIFFSLAPVTFVTSYLLFGLTFGAGKTGFLPGMDLDRVLPGGILECLRFTVAAFTMTFTAVVLSHFYLKIECLEPGGPLLAGKPA